LAFESLDYTLKRHQIEYITREQVEYRNNTAKARQITGSIENNDGDDDDNFLIPDQMGQNVPLRIK
jgi:hypothetical protein